MKRSIFSIIKKATLVKFSGTLPFVTAIVAAVTLSLFSHAAFAADTWGYCVIVDNHGHRARFSKIFHYPFLVTKFDLKPSAERFKSDTDSGFRAAPDCLVFNDEASAVEQRNTNMELMHRFGAEAYVMDYKVKYKNYPSTPAPQLASNPAGELPQNNGGSSTTPNSINEQPRVTIQNNNRVQLPSNNTSSHQPATQMRPHTRLSMQDALAQAEAKTRRLRQQARAGTASSSKSATGSWQSTSKTGSGGAAICIAVTRKNDNDLAYYYSYGRNITQYVAEAQARKRLSTEYSTTPSCTRSDENRVGALVVIAWQGTDDSGITVRTYGMGFGRSTGEAERQAVKNLSNRNWNWTRAKGYRVVFAKQY